MIQAFSLYNRVWQSPGLSILFIGKPRFPVLGIVRPFLHLDAPSGRLGGEVEGFSLARGQAPICRSLRVIDNLLLVVEDWPYDGFTIREIYRNACARRAKGYVFRERIGRTNLVQQ